MNLQVSSILFLLQAFAPRILAFDADETCPKGQAAAEKCQLKMRGAYDDASNPNTTEEEGLLRLCCGLGYAVDCIMHNAIPLCDKAERHELMGAANEYFHQTPLYLYGISCDDQYFVDRKVPKNCEGIVDAPNFNETVPMPPDDDDLLLVAIGAGVIIAFAVIAIIVAVVIHRKKRKAIENDVPAVRYNRDGEADNRV